GLSSRKPTSWRRSSGASIGRRRVEFRHSQAFVNRPEDSAHAAAGKRRVARHRTPQDFFAGRPLGLAAYERVLEAVAPDGPIDVRVSKSQVAFRRRQGFAYLWLPGLYLSRP